MTLLKDGDSCSVERLLRWSLGQRFPSMNQLVDQYLLFRLRAKRDPQAFGQLYDRYVDAIYRFVFLKLPSKEAAEDVTSETFLRSWQYIQGNQRVKNFRALLYRIARNLVADNYRKAESSGAHVTFSLSQTSTLMQEESDLSDRNRGRLVVEARAEVALILQDVSRLKEDFQDVLTLHLVEGLSFGEIGQVLEKTSGNVRVIYHRALKALESLKVAAESDGNIKT